MFPQSIRRNRLYGMYNPEESPTFDSPELNSQLVPSNDIQDPSLINEMTENYNPETAANERFNALLSQYPTREKPSMLRRIMAGLSQNPEMAERIKYSQYYQDLMDWKNKVNPFQQAADNETQQNINRRIMTTTSANTRIKADDEERKELADRNRFDQTNRRLATAERLADIRAKVANGGVLKSDEATGKTFMVYKDGTKKDVDITDITPEQIEELKHTNRMEEISARGDISGDLADKRAWSNPIQVTNKDGSAGPVIRTNRVTGEVQIVDVPGGGMVKSSPGGRAGTPQSETQKIVGQVRRANQLRAKNPNWADWIIINGNKVSITKPSDNTKLFKGSGPDKDTYNKIRKEIFEPEVSQTETEYIQVKSLRTGRTGKFPANKPLPEGYERIK